MPKNLALGDTFNAIFSPWNENNLEHLPETIRFQQGGSSEEGAPIFHVSRPKTSHSSARPPLTLFLDGPYGAPSSALFHDCSHAVLICTGIGVTPFASILQSIMFRYWQARRQCPNCTYKWSEGLHTTPDFNLKKVDFYWINKEQKSFEWFLQLLAQLEIEQAEFMRTNPQGQPAINFLDIHLHITAFSPTKNPQSVALKLALDLMHKKVKNSA